MSTIVVGTVDVRGDDDRDRGSRLLSQSVTGSSDHSIVPFHLEKCQAVNESPALLEGRVQHTVFLEHHKFHDEFAIDPGFDKRTKAGKEGYQDWTFWVGWSHALQARSL
jgi:hypothetical protein